MEFLSNIFDFGKWIIGLVIGYFFYKKIIDRINAGEEIEDIVEDVAMSKINKIEKLVDTIDKFDKDDEEKATP